MKKYLFSVMALLFPVFALACGGGKVDAGAPPPEFLGQIYDVIDVKDLPEKQSGFIRWAGSLDDLNTVIERKEKVGLEPGQTTKEPVFGTLAEAMNNRQPTTNYYIQVKLDEGVGYGQAIATFNGAGKELQGYAIYRCWGSPQRFVNKLRLPSCGQTAGACTSQ